jgi:hypothetical protein
MSEGTIVLGCHWFEQGSELTYVTRSIAGAASRCGPVSVLVPGPFGRRQSDGAFDLDAIGPLGELRWPPGLPSDRAVVVDDLTPDLAALLSGVGAAAVFYVASSVDEPDPTWCRLDPLGTGVYVPANPLAELHRHHGFGFTGYQLVLSDRSGAHQVPPPAAAWLSSAFHDADVVVVEDAVASAWRGRALRGKVSVDTRMDLWRLVAHASFCVDLAPGPYIARECVEALRFGTPIIVPEHSGPAEVHAREGGGSTFGDPGELVAAAGKMRTEANRSAASAVGRRYADSRFGDPLALLARLSGLLHDE